MMVLEVIRPSGTSGGEIEIQQQSRYGSQGVLEAVSKLAEIDVIE